MKKIALLLSVVSTTVILSGCCCTRGNAGGVSETQEYTSGTSSGTRYETSGGVYETSGKTYYEYTSGGMQIEPTVADPSLPEIPYQGVYTPPPN